jgi:Tol biopolymer transport system component
MKLRILLAGLIFGVALLAADSGAELFQKAVTQEQAAGNLPEAIRLYQQVAKDYASNRPLAAKALIQAARCYEKLGEDKATKVYEQVARDFSDQREYADTARTRLAALRQSAPVTMTARKIESRIPGAIATVDGQHLVYIDPGGPSVLPSVVTSDKNGNNKHTVLKLERFQGGLVDISRDSSLFVTQKGQLGGAITLALVKFDGAGYRELGSLAGFSTGRISFSWDNRYALVATKETDGSAHLIRIALADGGRQELLRRENTVIQAMQYSPDGRYIALAEGSAGSSRALVAPAAGGEPRLISEDAGLVDWTRDGRYLAINRGKGGARALYLVPIGEGRTAGDPVFIRNGSIEYGMTLPSGALLYVSMAPPSGPFVSIGSLDADGHVEQWKPLELESGVSTDPHPDWSPDGRQVSYIADRLDAGQLVKSLRVRDLTTGADRELYSGSARFSLACDWAAQHPRIFCTESTSATTDILSISLNNGQVERLGSVPGFWVLYYPRSDDRGLYMNEFGKGLVEWDLETRNTTELGSGGGFSPDGKWTFGGGLPTDAPDPALHYTLWFRPISSTAQRRVGYFRMEPWRGPGPVHVTFSSDGAWFYYHARDAQGKDALFRMSTAGGNSVRLGDFPSHVVEGTMKLSRDGRQIIVVAPDAGARRSESWLLENFEPRQTATR